MTTLIEDIVSDVADLVQAESPSSDFDALHRCADELCRLAELRTGLELRRWEVDGRPIMEIGDPASPVLLLGHLDTVHPIGSIKRNPCKVDNGRITGPGVLDMKSGIVMGLHALSKGLGASMLLTSDEELGTPSSREVILRSATGRAAVLVLEPAAGSSVKVARKGVGRYVVRCTGRAAHVGLDVEKGANALVGMSQVILDMAALSNPSVGTIVTPTTAVAGVTSNTVPETASFTVDVRAWSVEELERVADGLRSLRMRVDGVELDVEDGLMRPPLDSGASSGLFRKLVKVADRLGLDAPTGEKVGGGSDGNLTAALGIPTLDGLGGSGDGAHAASEWVDILGLTVRVQLLMGLIEQCSARGGLDG